MAERSSTANDRVIVTNPPIARWLFESTASSWIWLLLRLYVGYTWISASLEKLDSPAWMQTGAALKGFWTAAVAVPAPPARAPIAFEWYRTFIQSLLNAGAYTWFAKLVAISEMAVGVLLVLGAFTGLAAFIGAFMNWNFMMAGTASINPLLFVLTVGLILAWKVAGWLGLDHWLLPALGTPWGRGRSWAKTDPTTTDRV